MFKKILIANRGEIALRIIRCCREMNIRSLAVYSTEDKNSLPVMLAQESVCIGPAKAKDSYLNQDALIETAIKTNCDAIHPGYGFLSENADFAKKCEENGIVFIGPSSDLISKMGDKQTAREIMKKNNVPVVPGSDGCIDSAEEAMAWAEKVGYPVLIKASAGGGGKGMRRVYKAEDMKKNFDSAKAEAEAAFGNGDLYLEKLIIDPRHIEVQILADKHGNVIHLGERDCSLQRNNQKLLEESPAVFIDEDVRASIRQAAVNAAKAVGYFSAGTVEFVLDKTGKFYFIEMNTRIQVEHPVTECATGVDLIREQILIALGRKLSYSQEDISINVHVIECRINALSTGKIKTLHLPAGFGVRVESALFEGCEISPYYDSMIAKLIVLGSSRREAVRRLRRILEEIIIDGIETNAHLMYLLTYQPEFIRGGYDTSYWKKIEGTLVSELTEVNKRQ
ncbi:MAG TPA: acetyl-CoA carboxylase biotin carboxylase subunit [Candidatus Alectryocaccobium stercorigallinarum]|jgi:acetyl-CoA carboxylase biotin carboxylase subunit|nr:acetyl-CoA carboxylase biotin carboxylase subunit [Candidatus Alectryocaccobium stercorigallinarum]